jgi:hypothetical protein
MGASGIRKATPGIMGPWPVRVHIDPARWNVDVGSPPPGRAEAPKGAGAHCLKGDVSWVQNVATQFGRLSAGGAGGLTGARS